MCAFDARPAPSRLQARLQREPQPLFAVIDGALIEDLAGRVEAAGLFCKALYKDSGGGIDPAVGPYLTPLPGPEAVNALFSLEPALVEAAAVFWAVPQGPHGTADALWSHFRSLTKVEIPRAADDHRGQADSGEYEAVLFRLGDPSVMARTFPCLTAAQRQRLMGPAWSMILSAPHGPGLVEVTNEDPEDRPAHRLLRLSQGQYDRIIDGYRETLINKAVERYGPLYEAAPAKVRAHVRHAFDRAEGYGFGDAADIFDFVEMDAQLGPKFERGVGFEKVQRLLAREDIDDKMKMVQVKAEIGFVFGSRLPW